MYSAHIGKPLPPWQCIRLHYSIWLFLLHQFRLWNKVGMPNNNFDSIMLNIEWHRWKVKIERKNWMKKCETIFWPPITKRHWIDFGLILHTILTRIFKNAYALSSNQFGNILLFKARWSNLNWIIFIDKLLIDINSPWN